MLLEYNCVLLKIDKSILAGWKTGKNESTFTKEVFLPAFIKIMEETGKKPLIVSFHPAESDGSNYWYHYSEEYFDFVSNKAAVSEMQRHKVAAQ
jgi:hypothetical protein